MTLTSRTVPSFYQIDTYVPEVDRVIRKTLNHEYIHISERSRPAFEMVMRYFNEVTFERAGILPGEYALVNDLIMIRRDGMYVKANLAWEDPYVTRAIDDFCASVYFHNFARSVIEVWEHLPVIEAPLLLSTPYPNNYFHWTFETAPKSRFFQDPSVTKALISASNLHSLFQRNLLSHTLGKRELIVPQHEAIRVRDPRVSHDVLSEHNVQWLRDTTRFPVESGGRRIYLRRSSRGTRTGAGGGISESLEFLYFLKEYNFEVFDFGDRELGVDEQVMLLDKAGVILAPHGASLSNLTYLKAPLSVIEIVGSSTPGPVFLHLANMLKFEYYGLFSYDYDENQNIIIDMDELRTAMKNCLG